MKRTPFKPSQKPLQAHKPIRKRSPKRAAYMASSAREEAEAHMMEVKGLPCIVCSAPPPSSAHHCTGRGQARDDRMVIPLCYECHQGPQGYHARKRTWVARHGEDIDLVPRVYAMLGKPMPE